MELKKTFETYLEESSLSRIWQHISNPKTTFTVLTPYRAHLSDEENEERMVELKKKVRDMNLGYIEIDGAYTEEQTGKLKGEASLFIPNIKRKQAMEIGKDYEQDSIIFKDSDNFQMIGTNKDVGIGKVLMDYNIEEGQYDFYSDLMKEFYSSLKKGSHAKRKFLFRVKEG